MAGFIDGEGNISINRQVRKDRPSPAYRAYICVSNSDREVLEIFLKSYGGKIYCVSENRKSWYGKKWSDSYCWYCPISSSKRALLDMLPYLRLKGKQAQILLDFIQSKKAFSRKLRKRENRLCAPFRSRNKTQRTTPDGNSFAKQEGCLLENEQRRGGVRTLRFSEFI
jgi:hypothetical protein